MSYLNQPTVVSMALVCVDHKVIVEMSNDTLVELSTPWGCPDEHAINRWTSGSWCNLTLAQLRDSAQAHNSALHLSKSQLFGHNYQARGY